MKKSIVIGKNSEKCENELKNHKRQLFLNRKRKNDSDDSSPINSPHNFLSFNSNNLNSHNRFMKELNKNLSDEINLESNCIVIESPQKFDRRSNMKKYINLQLDEDNKSNGLSKPNKPINIDIDNESYSGSEKESTEYMEIFKKNRTDTMNSFNQFKNINPNNMINNTNSNFGQNLSNNYKEKLIRDFCMDIPEESELVSSIVVLDNINNKKKEMMNKNIINPDSNTNITSSRLQSDDDICHINHYRKNYSNIGNYKNCEMEEDKSNSMNASLFSKEFIKFSKTDGEKEKENSGTEINIFKSQSSCDNVENINSLSYTFNNQRNFFPWLTDKTKSLRGMIKLHQEILDFYEFIKPTSEEDKLRDVTIRRLKELIKEEFPNWKVKKFGSFPNKIHLPDSDVDIVILPKHQESSEGQLKILKKILKKLVKNDFVDYIKLIEARVPIIRATLKETKISIDISANRKNGYEAKKVIKKTLEDFPFIRPLIYILKYFLRQRKLNETYTGGISSFLLFNLLLSYIQHVVKNEDKINSETGGEKFLSLGHLLVGFLQFFGFDFNFEEVGISVKYGGYFYKKSERGW